MHPRTFTSGTKIQRARLVTTKQCTSAMCASCTAHDVSLNGSGKEWGQFYETENKRLIIGFVGNSFRHCFNVCGRTLDAYERGGCHLKRCIFGINSIFSRCVSAYSEAYPWSSLELHVYFLSSLLDYRHAKNNVVWFCILGCGNFSPPALVGFAETFMKRVALMIASVCFPSTPGCFHA